MWSRHDLLTVNEIFFRRDYAIKGDERVIVDFGSNIGISALFFLTFAPNARVFLHEPVSFNVDRMMEQLSGFEGRYSLSEVAIGTQDGLVAFGIEPSGRYCGIGKKHPTQVEVPSRAANSVLKAIITAIGEIDVLKVDIEGFERAVITSLSPEVAERIGRLYVEATFTSNPLSTHIWNQSANLASFIRINCRHR